MYKSEAQTAASYLKFVAEVAETLSDAYKEANRDAEKISEKNSKLRDEKEELEECLEETKGQMQDVIVENQRLTIENTRLIEQAASDARVTDALRVNIRGFQKDMDGSVRIIDDLRKKVKQYEEYAAYAFITKCPSSFQDWSEQI